MDAANANAQLANVLLAAIWRHESAGGEMREVTAADVELYALAAKAERTLERIWKDATEPAHKTPAWNS